VQSIDRMLRRILWQVPTRTYVVLTSDNGLHLGQHGLGRGKGSAYDTDVRVPLLVVGPGVRPGARREVVSNIDLAPTFEDLAGIASPRYRSGRSLVPTFADVGRSRNDYAFVEHTWSGDGDDPDSGQALRRIPSYIAVRSRGAVLIRSDLDRDPARSEFVWEFYEYADAPYERTNTYAAPRDLTLLARMKRKLRDFTRCSNLVHNDAVSAECRRDLRR
jgi:arylsulfatase A-like enzyme